MSSGRLCSAEGSLENSRVGTLVKSEGKLTPVSPMNSTTPLRDSTNRVLTHSSNLKAEVPKTPEDDENKHEETVIDSSQKSHDPVQLDSEGFVIWADSSQEQVKDSELEEENRVLRAALYDALEENRTVLSTN